MMLLNYLPNYTILPTEDYVLVLFLIIYLFTTFLYSKYKFDISINLAIIYL